MPITRVSTYSNHQSVLRDTGKVQAELAQLQNQVSSGLKASNFSGLTGQVEQFTDLEQKLGRTQRYIENNSLGLSRLGTTSTALDRMIDIVDSFKNLIVLRRSANSNDDLAFEQQVQGYWKSFAGELNSSLEGRYLFSGTKTDTQPVDDTSFPVSAESGVPDDGYYQGSGDDIRLRAQDNFEMIYNVRADDPAFQKVAAALALSREAAQGNDDAKFQQAFDLAQEGLEGLIGVQTVVNANKVTLEQINDRHTSLKLYWQGVREALINTDMIGASTQVAVNQGILQASFQIFARLSSLRLSDFLR